MLVIVVSGEVVVFCVNVLVVFVEVEVVCLVYGCDKVLVD